MSAFAFKSFNKVTATTTNKGAATRNLLAHSSSIHNQHVKKSFITVKQALERGRKVHAASSATTDQEVSGGIKDTLSGDEFDVAHDASRAYTVRRGQDDGTALLPVQKYLDDREGEKPLGVYALYDNRADLQYVGYSRNMLQAIQSHLDRVGPQRCHLVRAMVIANKAMASNASLQRQAANWIEQHGAVPLGNGPEQELWEGAASDASTSTAALAAAVSEVERAEHVDKVGGSDGSGKANGEQSTSSASGNISSSSAAASSSSASSSSGSSTTVSPFTKSTAQRSIDEVAPALELNAVNVELTLDQVRPYLLADGGDIDVVEVDNGRVFLKLQGNCSTCASSATTMKMGVERSLKAAFGSQLKEIIQLQDNEPPKTTAEVIDMHLNQLRGAISNFGGKVEVAELTNGRCVVRYSGPAPIGKGVQAAIKDQFKDVKEVVLTGF